jgi:hypothetical protein
MDAQELPQALTPLPLAPPAAGSPFSCLEQCAPSRCRPRCALDVVDQLLMDATAVSGSDADCLLDLRRLLQARRQAETAVRLFCELRRRLESSQYLALYRLRRWLENHVVAEVHPALDAGPMVIPVRLDFHCVEAVRRLCLCAATAQGAALRAPRLTFKFVPLPEPAPPHPASPLSPPRGEG